MLLVHPEMEFTERDMEVAGIEWYHQGIDITCLSESVRPRSSSNTITNKMKTDQIPKLGIAFVDRQLPNQSESDGHLTLIR